MRLTLVRHAESFVNTSKLIGDQDTGLTSIGQQQCVHLASRRQEFANATVIVSDLPRAVETAHRVLEPGASVTFDPRWRERYMGSVELTEEELRIRYPAMRDFDGGGFFDAKTDDGESMAEVDSRVAVALKEVLSSPYDHVVVFTHGGPILLTLCRLLGLDPRSHLRRFIVENTAIATFQYNPSEINTILVAGWNDVSHLPVELRTGPSSKTI